MLVSLWSPKGGSGTSVVAAAFASVLARHHRDVRLIDLVGDQPAICGVGVRGEQRGIGDWLAAGPTTPASAIESFALDDLAALSLVPAGSAAPVDCGDAGAALAVVLRDDPRISVLDAGLAVAPAARSLVELADLSLLVVRACVLALRRAYDRHDLVHASSGLLLVDEPHRSLHARDVAELAGRPILGTVPCVPDVARAVDAGLLLARAPVQLFRPLEDVVQRLGLGGRPVQAA
ncbi:MAG TPA: hypothetical protein VGI86_01715 [Acidimicrobiia bacterium]